MFSVSCINPQFKDPKPYSPITDLTNLPKLYNATNPGPYGYSSAILPYHGNIESGVLVNPVIQIANGLSGTQIQIRVETKVNGASIW